MGGSEGPGDSRLSSTEAGGGEGCRTKSGGNPLAHGGLRGTGGPLREGQGMPKEGTVKPALHAVLQRSEGAVAERLGSGGEGAAAERLGSGGRARLRWSAGAPRPGPCGMRGPGTPRDEASPLDGSPLPGSVPWTHWALAHMQGPSGVQGAGRGRRARECVRPLLVLGFSRGLVQRRSLFLHQPFPPVHCTVGRRFFRRWGPGLSLLTSAPSRFTHWSSLFIWNLF